MRVTMLLPGVLREHAAGAGQLELDLPGQAATLAAALDVVAGRHPGLERRLRDERGALRRYVNLFVDGEECRRLAGADTPLRDGAEIQVIPSIAGG
ncbi:MoaD/ThiS family protein [Frankia sp. CNm7]|uniref:MoaD/ThiS family protein n=1 Tax=Frankia nepalensis TaxID=1836974 RepID=A0A937RHM9_9ACTN|nr:MoaD/ThiS family protein [Frankia nepalensis]MBL7502216.1 MoaD/ThiS family protein [Frankia nepalensis]MBL7513052.1 MoaD/ThiS family protein [Frankia nepalensis]MBL7523819.1 MoaD/ThiS family protein [Frankia nepalensis]MBL7630327.1 MoaD/ThiS family protein [Frankia nepalensis]